jgi:aminoglycoside phosphotransferase (APT) family kinase protein
MWGGWPFPGETPEFDSVKEWFDIQSPPNEILQGLRYLGLLADGTLAQGCPLAGGVSSDIWRIDLASGPICVKRALSKLRVATDWRVPVTRNIYEARWMRRAAAAVPGAVPALLGQDETSGTLAMQYLPPESHPLWKTELRHGRADPDFARAVAATLVRIHASTAADPTVAAEFPTDKLFYDLRLEPYLLAAAAAHPESADALLALVKVTSQTKRAMVHGDVSPKNILVGPEGPVFLDAECAWWGDPAFDLAFCLNHLLLKCLWVPAAQTGFLACFETMAATYLAGVTWEDPAALEKRSAHLLPGLLLARVDGKSPVEYLTKEADKNRGRRFACSMLAAPEDRLDALRRAWADEMGR